MTEHGDEETDGLSTVAEGAGMVFGGRLLKLTLLFLIQVIMARFLGQVSYGGVILASTVIQIGVIAGTLGVDTGVVRKLPEYEDDSSKARGILYTAMLIGLVGGVGTAALVFLNARIIAVAVFNDPQLVELVRIAAFGIAGYVFMEIGISIGRGFRDARPHVITRQIVRPVVSAVAVGGAIAAGYGAVGAMTGIVIALGVGAIVAVSTSYRTVPFPVTGRYRFAFRELVTFSVPLMFASSTAFLISNTDTFLLGVFAASGKVGLYNSAFQLQQLGKAFFYPVTFLLPPVLTRLQQKDQEKAVEQTYQTATKWMTIGTLPIFLAMFGFPAFIIEMSFGGTYVAASSALMILTVPVVVTVILGANGATLIALGHNKINMYVNGGVAILNVVLNLLLIPLFGIVGAAVASATAFVARDIAYSLALNRWHGVQPFSRATIRLLFMIGLLFPPVYYLFQQITTPTIISIALLGLLGGAAYLTILVRIGAFARSDVEVLLELEESTGVNLRPVKSIYRTLAK